LKKGKVVGVSLLGLGGDFKRGGGSKNRVVEGFNHTRRIEATEPGRESRGKTGRK